MFARCAVLMPEGSDLEQALDAVRRVLDPGGRVTLVGWHRPRFWHLGDIWSGVDREVGRVEALLTAAADALATEGYHARCTLELADDAPTDSVPDDVELVIVPADPLTDAARIWTEDLLDRGRTVAWARGDTPPIEDASAVHAAVAYMGPARRALPAVAALRPMARGGETLTLLNLAFAEQISANDSELRQLMGWPGPFSVHTLTGPVTRLSSDLDTWLTRASINLLSVPLPPAGVARSLAVRALAGLVRPLPVLLVPDPGEPADAVVIDGPDLVHTGRDLVARLDTVDGFGDAAPLDDRALAVVVRGEVRAVAEVSAGRLPLPPLTVEPDDAPLLIGFAEADGGVDRLRAAVRLLAPGGRIALFDAEAPVDATTVARFDQPGIHRRWWAVRMDPGVPCRRLRRRLDHLEPEALIDAGAVLGDGDPDDLPAAARGVRLARVARHLRAGGVAVDLVLDSGPVTGAAAVQSAAWGQASPAERRRRVKAAFAPPPAVHDADGVMRTLTDAEETTATRVHVEFDNAVARRRLLELIDGAVRAVHLQIYIFEADHVGEAVVDALIEAAERGVTVRVLVDALFSAHGAMGQSNRQLSRLDAHPAVEQRIIRPFDVPGIDDLKRRDHRKIIVVDDRIGWVTGRNIGGPYYTGFDEVELTPDSSYRDVPWLDAGAEVEGPIVYTLARAFARHWVRAGGRPLPTAPPPPAGDIEVRLVMHESMGDAATLDAYLRLIACAEQCITIVNTFPLQFELQEALLRALRRGVKVRFVVGHVRPLFGAARTPFKGGAIRALATEVIHGRLDALVDAGAEAWGYVVDSAPGWSPTVHPVLPHVHAKMMTIDGHTFAIGSANLDITAGYWESEALLIVEDRAETARVDAVLERVIAAAVAIDAEPGWKATAARRVWVSRNWPSVLG